MKYLFIALSFLFFSFTFTTGKISLSPETHKFNYQSQMKKDNRTHTVVLSISHNGKIQPRVVEVDFVYPSYLVYNSCKYSGTKMYQDVQTIITIKSSGQEIKIKEPILRQYLKNKAIEFMKL